MAEAGVRYNELPISMSNRRQYIALSFLLCWALISQIGSSFVSVDAYLHRNVNLALPFNRLDSSTVIRYVPRAYRKSALQRGDDVVALNGRPVMGRKMLDEIVNSLHPGTLLMVKVARKQDGKTLYLEVPVKMRMHPEGELGWANLVGLQLFLPISCLLIGFYIVFARPSDPLAWITMAMLTSFGHIADSGTSWQLPSPVRELLFVYNPILSDSWALWLLLFSFYFPVPFRFIREHRWPVISLGLLALFFIGVDIYGNFATGMHMRENTWLASFNQKAATPVSVLFTVYIFGFFYLLHAKLRRLSDGDAKRRMRLMIYGCTAALLPLFPVVLSNLNFIPHITDWIQTCLLLMLLLFPITMAYVIVVERAMDVRMVIRAGVRYAIASHSLRVLRFLLIVGLATTTATLANESGHSWEAIAIASFGTAIIVGFRRVAERITKWMDRRFFREAYNAEIILTDLSNTVATMRDVSSMVETVASRIASSLHVERVAVLLAQGNLLQPVYALGFHNDAPPVFAPSKRTLQLVRDMGPSAQVYFEDPQSWVHSTSPEDRTTLQELGAQVLLPVSRKSRLLGLISLGPKRSEAPYSREDLQLLRALASQTGLALENAELTESIRREIVSRERLNRELEIAREVQQRLFPQNLPEIAGLDLAGYCRPALEVGGDYYDFIRLPQGCLGLAVGDVSGKGIAASLMMASLQASLRGQTIRPTGTLAEMIANINSLLYEASSASRYATFFYGKYDPETRRMRYVNAGHNAPVVYRAASGDLFRLDAGGTVLGLFASVPFSEGELELQSGDVLVAFTDGMCEAMDTSDDEFGEERLLATLELCGQCSSQETIVRLLADVDAFTAGAPQHDDMTLVVVRVQ